MADKELRQYLKRKRKEEADDWYTTIVIEFVVFMEYYDAKYQKTLKRSVCT